jgi:hypothetical protein
VPGLNRTQHAQLLAPVQSSRVAQLRGMSHLEAWDVRRWLIRIFGFTGWSYEVVEAALVHESIVPVNNKPRATVVYRVTGRLRIRDTDGNELAVFEDAATGDGVNMPSVGDAHDFALKTAVSQALKRCAANLGDQFGLSLYNHGSTEAVVCRVLAGAEQTSEMPNDPPVVADDEASRIAAQQDADAEQSQELPPPSPMVPTATREQLEQIARLLEVKRGATNGDRRAIVSQLVRRQIDDPRGLSQAEARSIIETLSAEPDRVQLPTTPEPSPAPAGKPERPVSPAQKKLMWSTITRQGHSHAGGHVLMSRILGREITSTDQLTFKDADTVIKRLGTGEIPAPSEPAPDAPGPNANGEGISEFDALDQMIADVNDPQSEMDCRDAIRAEFGRGAITASDVELLTERLAAHVKQAKAGV